MLILEKNNTHKDRWIEYNNFNCVNCSFDFALRYSIPLNAFPIFKLACCPRITAI
jgi:hypothetical protein